MRWVNIITNTASEKYNIIQSSINLRHPIILICIIESAAKNVLQLSCWTRCYLINRINIVKESQLGSARPSGRWSWTLVHMVNPYHVNPIYIYIYIYIILYYIFIFIYIYINIVYIYNIYHIWFYFNFRCFLTPFQKFTKHNINIINLTYGRASVLLVFCWFFPVSKFGEWSCKKFQLIVS